MKQVNFNLDNQDIEIVKAAALYYGVAKPNQSEVLRRILREWDYWRKQREQAELKNEQK